MNSHLMEHITKDQIIDMSDSVLFFLLMVVIISVVGIMFIAVA